MSKNNDRIREVVRENYAKVATRNQITTSCCSPASNSCCDTEADPNRKKDALLMGYSEAELAAVPEGANLGLGCGNPNAIANLKAGETVLDLGSGAGFDCFLAAAQVGEEGNVIGVDMTDEMIAKAQENAKKQSIKNVEFRKGVIENLPIEDNSVDVIISNCVVNLSPEKEKVYAEMRRVLKPGGRIAIADIVATAEIPTEVLNDDKLHCMCVSGASYIKDITQQLQGAGFNSVEIRAKDSSKLFIKNWIPEKSVDDFLVSADILAVKPK